VSNLRGSANMLSRLVGFLSLTMLVGCATTLPNNTTAPSIYEADAVAYSPDGQYIAATMGAEDSVFLFDAATFKAASSLTAKDGASGLRPFRPPGIAFSHDGKWLASASWRASVAIRIWEAASRTEIRRAAGFLDAMHLAFAPDDSRIATAGLGNDAFVRDAVSGTLLARPSGHAGPVPDVAGKTRKSVGYSG
jgi:WD40 repeat protein